MLSTRAHPQKLRAAWNLFPRPDGSLYTRPGALQVAAGRIGRAVAWGNRIVMERAGRVVLWDGANLHDLKETGYTLSGVAFQAVTGEGAREDRFYIADGLHGLWYIRRDGPIYEAVTVVNEVLDAEDEPYPIPAAFTIAAWRNRLWIGGADHRVYHSENDKPHKFDPLWELQFQSAGPDQVRWIKPLGETLCIRISRSIWGVTGTSPYNWQRDELASGLGASGQDSADTLGGALYYADTTGLYLLGQDQPLSADIREAFDSAPTGLQVVCDTQRRLLYLNVTGRVFVTHVEAPGRWTEFYGVPLWGVVAGEQVAGWYGTDGLWLLGQPWLQDQYADGTARPFTARFDTWDQRPNNAGAGRALCRRVVLVVSGPNQSDATYTVESDEVFFADTFTLTPDEPALEGAPGVSSESWEFRQQRRELVPHVPGTRFRHTIACGTPMEIHSFEPIYSFGGK